MRNTKYKTHFYSMFDHTGIRKCLEKMAANGWMLEKTGTFLWKYRRIEPKNIHFAVNYFPKASEFASEPSEEQKTLIEFCEQAGWKLAGTVAQMQIFYNEEENPVPLETDAAVQVEIISKAMKSSFLPAQILLLIVGILQMVMFFSRFFANPILILADNMNLFGGLCWLMAMILCGTDIINYFTWLKKARAAAERDGSFVETRSFPVLQLGVLVIMFVFLIGAPLLDGDKRQFIVSVWIAGYAIILIGGVNLVKQFLKRRKASAGLTRTLTFLASFGLAFGLMFGTTKLVFDYANDLEAKEEGVETYEHRGMTWEIHHDELPLIIEDFIDVDYEEYSYEMDVSETILAATYEATQRPRMDALDYPDLDYTITKIKAPLFYNICFEKLHKPQIWERANAHVEEEYRQYYGTIDAQVWQADAAYREYTGTQPWNNYLICWGNKIVEISFPEEPTEAQIAIVAEKLKNF